MSLASLQAQTTTQARLSACMVCGAPLQETEENYFDTRFGISSFYAISKCPGCALEQTLPRPNAAELKSLYESFYNFGGEKDTRYTAWRQLFLSSLFYRVWLYLDGDISFHGRRGKGRLLDVGCNEGRGLALYRSNGFTAEGLELNEEAANVARRKGFTVSIERLDQFNPTTPYDVVILSNVLEHALDPHLMLQDLKRILKPNGELWLSCPNSKSWLRSLFGRYWINWHVPFHLAHFSKDNLGRLLEKNGFEVLTKRQETPALWFTQSLIARLFAKRGEKTSQLRSAFLVLPTLLLSRFLLFPFFWLAGLLGGGDCHVFIARKR